MKDETWSVNKKYPAFKIEEGDVVFLNPICFDANIKDLKTGTLIKFNDHNSFSIAKDQDKACGILLSHKKEYYSLKEILNILYMFFMKKPKKDILEMEFIK